MAVLHAETATCPGPGTTAIADLPSGRPGQLGLRLAYNLGANAVDVVPEMLKRPDIGAWYVNYMRNSNT